MASFSSAARTNLTSQSVTIHTRREIGEGSFRIAYEGTYNGGNRNKQVAACKKFKPEFWSMEEEYFANDFRIADRAIAYAEQWNSFCCEGKELLFTKGESSNKIP